MAAERPCRRTVVPVVHENPELGYRSTRNNIFNRPEFLYRPVGIYATWRSQIPNRFSLAREVLQAFVLRLPSAVVDSPHLGLVRSGSVGAGTVFWLQYVD